MRGVGRGGGLSWGGKEEVRFLKINRRASCFLCQALPEEKRVFCISILYCESLSSAVNDPNFSCPDLVGAGGGERNWSELFRRQVLEMFADRDLTNWALKLSKTQKLTLMLSTFIFHTDFSV